MGSSQPERDAEASALLPASDATSRSCCSTRLTAWRSLLWDNGLLCGAIATLVFSVSSLLVKLTGGRVPVLQLCIIRSSISLLTSLGVGVAGGVRPLLGHRRHMHLLLARGLCGTAAITSSYYAVLSLPLGDAITLQQMRPPVTAAVARLLLGEPPGLRGAAGCAASVAGVVLLAHPPLLFGGHAAWGRTRLLATLAGVASTFFASGTSTVIRSLGRREASLTIALWFHLTTVAAMALPLALGWPEAPAPLTLHDAALLLGVASASFLAQLLLTRAFQLVAAARAAAVGFTGVLYAHVFGALLFGERLTPTTLGGGALILVGVLLVTLRRAPQQAAAGDSGDAGGAASAAAAKAGEAADGTGSGAGGSSEPTAPAPPSASSWLQRLWGFGGRERQGWSRVPREDSSSSGIDVRLLSSRSSTTSSAHGDALGSMRSSVASALQLSGSFTLQQGNADMQLEQQGTDTAQCSPPPPVPPPVPPDAWPLLTPLTPRQSM